MAAIYQYKCRLNTRAWNFFKRKFFKYRNNEMQKKGICCWLCQQGPSQINLAHKSSQHSTDFHNPNPQIETPWKFLFEKYNLHSDLHNPNPQIENLWKSSSLQIIFQVLDDQYLYFYPKMSFVIPDWLSFFDGQTLINSTLLYYCKTEGSINKILQHESPVKSFSALALEQGVLNPHMLIYDSAWQF